MRSDVFNDGIHDDVSRINRVGLGGFSQYAARAPFLDLAVVAGEQHFRHGHTSKIGGTRVLRKVEQLAGEGFVRQRLFFPEHAGNEARQGIDDHGSRQSPVRQDIIPNADFLVDQPITNPLIDAFVVTAQQNQNASDRPARGPSRVPSTGTRPGVR